MASALFDHSSSTDEQSEPGADGSSKAGGTSYGNVKDGNAGTYWAPGSATGYVSVKWGSATTVSSTGGRPVRRG